jgi:hypothetical protein
LGCRKSCLNPNSFHLTGQDTLLHGLEGGFYGIIGDDGKKYQPTNLPRKLKKDGLAIKFDAKRKDVISTHFNGEPLLNFPM